MHDGAHNQTRLWWDAVEHPSLGTVPSTAHQGNATVPFTLPTFTNLWLGWYEYQPTKEPFELWVDEIAIDGARIGCAIGPPPRAATLRGRPAAPPGAAGRRRAPRPKIP